MEDRFDSITEKAGACHNVRLRYGFHDVAEAVRAFFVGPFKGQGSSDVFVDTAQTIVMQGDVTSETIEASKHLLEQQRMLEDTRARRRLERWATRTITWYLVVVLALVIANGIVSSVSGKEGTFITGGIMTVVLTTTTINVIGLGLIVLRGHFPQKDKSKENEL